MMKKHDHWYDVFPRQRKCVSYQTYKLKLSNLERKLFIGMVCKKMGEEVDLNTFSFLCHFFHRLSTLQDIRQMFDKFGLFLPFFSDS